MEELVVGGNNIKINMKKFKILYQEDIDLAT
jgi:hypothetical protein